MVVVLVLHVDDNPLIGNNDGKIVSSDSMVVHPIQYEGLRRSQSHNRDQAYARSSKKDVGLILSYLYRYCSCKDKHA